MTFKKSPRHPSPDPARPPVFARPAVFEAIEHRRMLSSTPTPAPTPAPAVSAVALAVPTIPAFAATATRPAANTGVGFFVSGGEVYDPNGERFVMRGVSNNHWWGNPTTNEAAISQFRKTGANTVRTIFGTGYTGGSETPADRQRIVEKYLAQGLTPVVEDHMATCDNDAADLAEVVDRWLDPANVAWLKKYEDKVILNIANEWGPDAPAWRDAYVQQVGRLRAAGVNNLLMVDAGGCGQAMHTLDTWGGDVLAADPQHNVVFSIHFYSEWRTENRAADVGRNNPATGDPWDVATELADARRARLPIVVGEFSSDALSFVPYQTRRVMEVAEGLGVGWIAYSWNQNNPEGLNMLPGSNWRYDSDADLTAWGNLVVNDPQVGLKATGRPATVWAGPQVVGADYENQTREAFVVRFDADVAPTLTTGDFSVTNLTTGAAVPASEIHLGERVTTTDAVTPGRTGARGTTATLRFDRPLGDGVYEVRLRANAVADADDPARVRVDRPLAFHFYALAGDADGNHRVDALDLRRMLLNWGRPASAAFAPTFAGGDFDHDGRVDAADLKLLVANYGRTLVAPAVAPADAPASLLDDARPDPLPGRTVRRARRAGVVSPLR